MTTSDPDGTRVELHIPEQLRQLIAKVARENGNSLESELLKLITASFPRPMQAFHLSEADLSSVASKVALMAGRRSKSNRAPRKRKRRSAAED